MNTETNTFALKTAINEIKSTCPGISKIFILNENEQVITQDQNTTPELVTCAANSLTTLTETATVAGDLESLTCSGASQRINLTRYETNYLVTLSSKETDEKTLKTLARVLIPSMLKLAQEVVTSRKENVPVIPQPKSPAPIPTRAKPLARDLPVPEFVVETISGISIFSGDPNTIQVDRALIGQWKEFYGDKHIENVIVEEVITGRRVQCKFQPLKNEDLEGQNIVLIPGRIQAKLEIKKGASVRIRPILENGEKKK